MQGAPNSLSFILRILNDAAHFEIPISDTIPQPAVNLKIIIYAKLNDSSNLVGFSLNQNANDREP